MEKRLQGVTILGGILLLFLLFAFLKSVSPPAPAPKKSLPQPQWYLINKAVNQVSTAYTEPPGAPPSSSARPYFIGAVAVHPRVAGGSHLEPIIPFGTVIYLEKPKSITIQGMELDAFTVIDTGDASWALWPDSPYWIDLFFGTTNYWSNKAAAEYGKKSIDYYWYEPLR